MTTQPIKRQETFIVAEAEKNEYEALIVTDTTGKEHKIGDKRSHLFELFAPGNEVKVGISEFKGKEYIATAIVLSHEPKTITAEENKAVVEAVKEAHTPKPDTKSRSVAMSYAKDCFCAGKIPEERLIELADFFLSYMEQQ